MKTLEDKVTLWTYQDKRVYDKLMQDGVYCRSDDTICDEDFAEPYKYMVKQMQERIGQPQRPETKWPMWAWRYYHNARRPKPRRDYYHIGDEQDEVVFMEICIDKSRILESRFMLWHCVLNRFAIDENENADPEPTWYKIFDREFVDEHWGAKTWEDERIQACFWTLRKEDVVYADLMQKQEGIRAVKVTRLYRA